MIRSISRCGFARTQTGMMPTVVPLSGSVPTTGTGMNGAVEGLNQRARPGGRPARARVPVATAWRAAAETAVRAFASAATGPSGRAADEKHHGHSGHPGALTQRGAPPGVAAELRERSAAAQQRHRRSVSATCASLYETRSPAAAGLAAGSAARARAQSGRRVEEPQGLNREPMCCLSRSLTATGPSVGRGRSAGEPGRVSRHAKRGPVKRRCIEPGCDLPELRRSAARTRSRTRPQSRQRRCGVKPSPGPPVESWAALSSSRCHRFGGA